MTVTPQPHVRLTQGAINSTITLAHADDKTLSHLCGFETVATCACVTVIAAEHEHQRETIQHNRWDSQRVACKGQALP